MVRKGHLQAGSKHPRSLAVQRHSMLELQLCSEKRQPMGTGRRDGMWKNLGVEDLEDGSKGKSFGKGKGKGFGKGKGKGKGKTEQLALEDKKDEEKTEEDEMKDALKKARKARDSVASTLNDLEDALGKASSKLSRQGKAAAEGWKVQLNKQLADLKGALSGKKTKKASDMKKMLEEAAKVIKGSKDEAKELKALGNKAASVASSKRSRSSK